MAAQVGLGDDESVKHEQKRVPPSFLPPSDSEPKRRASSRGGDASRSAAADRTPREPISKKGRGVIPLARPLIHRKLGDVLEVRAREMNGRS